MDQLGAIPAAPRRVAGPDERHPSGTRRWTLLRESLSVRGFDTARNVMKLNAVLGEITGNWEFFGEWLYFLCIFGTPSMEEPWGWQIDGHHLNLSYLVLKDQVVMTPAFWGAEPAIADRGPHAGLREFDAEQRNGLELIRALSRPQQEKAIVFQSIISADLPPERYTPPDGRQQAVSFKDNVVIPYEGLRAEALTPGQRYLLLRSSRPIPAICGRATTRCGSRR